jgi:GTPase SAR1 family protein
MEISPFYKIKCLLCGEINTGKSSILHLVTSKTFKPDMKSTIGLGFDTLGIKLEEYPILNPQKLPNFYINACKDDQEDKERKKKERKEEKKKRENEENEENREERNENKEKEEKEEEKKDKEKKEKENKEKDKENEKDEKLQFIKLHIWDSSGSMRFRDILSSYTRDVDICFLVFDISKRASWEFLPLWKEEVEKNCREKPHFVIIGSKSDLRPHEVEILEIEDRALKWNTKYYIMSAIKPDSFLTVRRIFYESTKNYHENLLILQNENKSLPDRVLSTYYIPKESSYLNLEDVGEKSRFCCFQ